MIAAVYVLYILTCLFLIMVVLLQAGKGDSMGAVFGGSSGTILGNRGAATFLSKLTVGSAVLFMLLSIFLAFHASSVGSRVGRGRVAPGDAPAAAGGVGDDEGVGEAQEIELVFDEEEAEPEEFEEAEIPDEEPSTPAETDDSAAEELPPAEPTTDEPPADETTPEDPAVDEPTSDEPAPAVPTTDEPAPAEPTTDEPAAEQPEADDPVPG